MPRLGPKAFEQCAGFLRIRGGDDPLDASGVHPEAYPVVRRILERTGADVATLIGDTKTLRALNPAEFTDEAFGLPTVNDILKELEKPGRDPRPEFQTATFAEGVNTLGDLEAGMVLEGVVTNVAAFGAFVDIGVHQDGLVHVSAMCENFVADPRDGRQAGRRGEGSRCCRSTSPRNRISLTMRLRRRRARPGAAPGRPPRSPRMEARDSRSAPDSPASGGPGGVQSHPPEPRPGGDGRGGGAPAPAPSADGRSRGPPRVTAACDRRGGSWQRPRRYPAAATAAARQRGNDRRAARRPRGGLRRQAMATR